MNEPSTTTDPIPDEFCPHVEAGAEMTGGWYFAARVPPVAVGMCHDCMVWCQNNLDSPQVYDEYLREQWAEDDRVLDANEIG